MNELKVFLDNLGVVAKSPYAFVAYLGVVAAWIYITVSRHQLKTFNALPADQRSSRLKQKYNAFPATGLSGEEFIKSERNKLLFWGFIAAVVAVVLLGTVALVRSQTPSTVEVPPKQSQPSVSGEATPGKGAATASATQVPGPKPKQINNAVTTNGPNTRGATTDPSWRGVYHLHTVLRSSSDLSSEFTLTFRNSGNISLYWEKDQRTHDTVQTLCSALWDGKTEPMLDTPQTLTFAAQWSSGSHDFCNKTLPAHVTGIIRRLDDGSLKFTAPSLWWFYGDMPIYLTENR